MRSFRKAVNLELPGVLVGSDGQIAFTVGEKQRIGRLFAMAGINIDSVRTVEAYIRARQRSQCFFDDWLQAEIAMKPMCPERRALLKVISGSPPGDSSDLLHLVD